MNITLQDVVLEELDLASMTRMIFRWSINIPFESPELSRICVKWLLKYACNSFSSDAKCISQSHMSFPESESLPTGSEIDSSHLFKAADIKQSQ